MGGLGSVHAGQAATSQKPQSIAWGGRMRCPLVPSSPFLPRASVLYPASGQTDVFHYELATSLRHEAQF